MPIWDITVEALSPNYMQHKHPHCLYAMSRYTLAKTVHRLLTCAIFQLIANAFCFQGCPICSPEGSQVS